MKLSRSYTPDYGYRKIYISAELAELWGDDGGEYYHHVIMIWKFRIVWRSEV